MSASVLSKYACSRDCKYAPSGVANHAASVPVDRTLVSIEDSAMPAIIPIPAFADNYIWLLRHDAKAAVVDPGDAAPVIEHLEPEGIELCAIVNTHHPGDHFAGNHALLP